MKILSICYRYGDDNPVAIINKNMFNTLSKNNDIKVMTAFVSDSESKNEHLSICSPCPYRPNRIFNTLGNLLGKNIDNIAWEFKTKRKIKKILKEWKPDIIYARGEPLSPLHVGYTISKKYNIPLMIHSTDPFPPPIEWKPDEMYRKKILNGIRPILKHADKVSGISKAMLAYQERASGIKISDKSIVLYNPLSKTKTFKAPPLNTFIFLYIGTFYGSRKPDSLINGFLEFSKKNNTCELHIVGNNNHLMHHHGAKIKILPYSTKPFELMENANVLIDVDSNNENDVYISSKLSDYLSVNRTLLSITPTSSPARELLSSLRSSVFIATHKHNEIINAFDQAFKLEWNPKLFKEREELRDNLSLENNVKETEKALAQIIESRK